MLKNYDLVEIRSLTSVNLQIGKVISYELNLFEEVSSVPEMDGLPVAKCD
jgi:hypothetical protein